MERQNRWMQIQSERRATLRLPESIWERPVAAPLSSVCDGPLVCLSVNSEWATYFAGAIGALLDMRHWAGDQGEHDRIEQQVERVLEQMSYSCDQAPAAASYGDAIGWVDNLILSYDGTPESVHPAAPDTTFASDGDDTPAQAACRHTSLCRAAEIVVQTACEMEIQRRASGSTWIGLSAYLPAVLLPLIVSNPAAWVGVGLGLLAWGINAWVKGFNEASDAQLSNKCAQAAVACCLADTLAPLAVSFGNFQHGLDDCGLTGDAEAIRRSIAYLLADYTLYLIFIAALGTAQVACVDVAGDGCGCDVYCHLFDFAVDDYIFGPSCPKCGTWVLGSGWQHEDDNPLGLAWQRSVRINSFHAIINIRRVRIHVQYTGGHFEGAGQPPALLVKLGSNTLLSVTRANMPDGDRWFEWTGNVTANSLQAELVSSYDNQAPKTFAGTATILALEVAGCGANPFGPCNTCLPPQITDCP